MDPGGLALSFDTGSTRAAQTLNSGMRLVGSSAPMVRRLADCSPGQWNGMKTVSGRMSRVTLAVTSTEPRRVRTAIGPPSTTFRRAAVCGWSSATAVPDIAFSAGTRRVIVPDWYWARTRPVVRKSG